MQRSVHQPAPLFDRQAKAAFIACLITLSVCGLGFYAGVSYWNIQLRKLPVPLRDPLSDLPRRLGDWAARGDDGVLTAEVTEQLGTDQYLDRTYVREDESGRASVINVHIAYYTGMIDAVPHVPDRCLEAGGWAKLSPIPATLPLQVDMTQWPEAPGLVHRKVQQPYRTAMAVHYLSGRPVTVHLPVGDLQLRTTEFQDERRPSMHIMAGYFFIANGQTTPNPYTVRTLAFEKRDRYAYYCKVQFVMGMDASAADQAAFMARVSDLTSHLLPELMRCLPDWPEVEARSDAPPGA